MTKTMEKVNKYVDWLIENTEIEAYINDDNTIVTENTWYAGTKKYKPEEFIKWFDEEYGEEEIE